MLTYLNNIRIYMSPVQFMQFLQINYPFPHITWDWLTDNLNNDVQEGLDFACNFLNERDVEIFVDKVIYGKRVSDISADVGVTRTRVYTIIDMVNSRLQNKTKIYLRTQGLLT